MPIQEFSINHQPLNGTNQQFMTMVEGGIPVNSQSNTCVISTTNRTAKLSKNIHLLVPFIKKHEINQINYPTNEITARRQIGLPASGGRGHCRYI